MWITILPQILFLFGSCLIFWNLNKMHSNALQLRRMNYEKMFELAARELYLELREERIKKLEAEHNLERIKS